MNTQLCQSCGHVIKGAVKSCSGCGAAISKFSPVALPVGSFCVKQAAASLDIDPLVLERVLNRVRQAISPDPTPSAAARSTHRQNEQQTATITRQPALDFFDTFSPGSPQPADSPVLPAGTDPHPQEAAQDLDWSQWKQSRYCQSGLFENMTLKAGDPTTSEKENLPSAPQEEPWWKSPALSIVSTIKIGAGKGKVSRARSGRYGAFALAALLIASVAAAIFAAIAGGIVSVSFESAPLSPAQTAMPELSGKWEIRTVYQGRRASGILRINQQGERIEGRGLDPLPYTINGKYSPPFIQFEKAYENPAAAHVSFQGRLDKSSTNPHMAGYWQSMPARAQIWRHQAPVSSDTWDAILLERKAPPWWQWPTTQQGWTELFFRLAVGGIAFSLLAVFASLKLFGSSGWLNIRAKKEYIPSQFKAQHYKMVRELGNAAKSGGLPLGERVDWNPLQAFLPRQLSLPPQMRAANPHLLVLGTGAKGKTRLLSGMIAHDIESNDRAVVVIDSDGCLVDSLVRFIGAHERAYELSRRLTVIDPTRAGELITYNPLAFPADGDLQSAASSIVLGFKALYSGAAGQESQWSPQTANILRNAAILLMANGRTLTDLPLLLTENDFRDILLEKVEQLKNTKAEYTTLIEDWNQYKRLARTEQWIHWVEPILNRVQAMLGNQRIRPILTRAAADLDLKDIIDRRKILLVKIPQGRLDNNGNLLGSLLVAGLKQAALALSSEGAPRRRPCALYIDEFDNFIEKETFDAITSETRNFQIGFVGVTKTLQGLPEDFRNQLLINTGTLACFALSKKDADLLGPQMFRVDGRKIKHQTLQNIFNQVNTSPQYELISDEEKLNIDRLLGLEERTFFCYRIGTVAGVFKLRVPGFADVADESINWTYLDGIYSSSRKKKAPDSLGQRQGSVNPDR